MLTKNFFNPKNVNIPPKANDKFAKLIEINVRNKVFRFLIYLMMSTKIIIFIKVIIKTNILNLLACSIFEKIVTKKIKKIKIGKIGCKPFIPEFNFTKFKKSIPKHILCNKKPTKILSL